MVRDEFSTASARWALPFSYSQACSRWRGSPAVIGGASACGARALAPEDCGSGGRVAAFLARSSSNGDGPEGRGGAAGGGVAIGGADCGGGAWLTEGAAECAAAGAV